MTFILSQKGSFRYFFCLIIESKNFFYKKSLYLYPLKKSQNCVKAAIAFLCTTCKRQLLFALLQLITFVCTIAIESILSTTPIVNFCMPYCNCQSFIDKITFLWATAINTIHHIITVIDF